MTATDEHTPPSSETTDVTAIIAYITAADRASVLYLLRSLDSGTDPADIAAGLAGTMAAVFNVWRDDNTDPARPHPSDEGGPWRLFPVDPTQPPHHDPTDAEGDQESRPIGTVHAVVIEHKSGSNVSTHLTAAGARKAVARFAVSWWRDSDGPMPDDQEELIATYFDHHQDEWCSIVETPIEA